MAIKIHSNRIPCSVLSTLQLKPNYVRHSTFFVSFRLPRSHVFNGQRFVEWFAHFRHWHSPWRNASTCFCDEFSKSNAVHKCFLFFFLCGWRAICAVHCFCDKNTFTNSLFCLRCVSVFFVFILLFSYVECRTTWSACTANWFFDIYFCCRLYVNRFWLDQWRTNGNIL